MQNQQGRPTDTKIRSNWLKCISFMRDRLTHEEKAFIAGKRPATPGTIYDTWLTKVNKLTTDIVKRSVTELARLEEIQISANTSTSIPKRNKKKRKSGHTVEKREEDPFLSSVARRLGSVGYETTMK